jgi:hypothetical protein
MTRWICTECRFIGPFNSFDTINDPKVAGNTWTICPRCRAAERVTDVCDTPGCDNEASCGWPSDEGYRRTCWEHSVFKRERDAKQKAGTL